MRRQGSARLRAGTVCHSFDKGEYFNETHTQKIAAAVLCAALCLALAGCAPVGEAYPVSFGGVNITVGETTVEALLDAGYTIRALDENGVMGDVDATAQLNANSYYSGLYLAKDGVNCAGLEVTADEAVPLSRRHHCQSICGRCRRPHAGGRHL